MDPTGNGEVSSVDSFEHLGILSDTLGEHQSGDK